MKAQPVGEYRAQRRGGRGKQATTTKEDDFVDRMFIANTHDYILCFSQPRTRVLAQGLQRAAGTAQCARQADRQSGAARSTTRRSRRSCRSRSSRKAATCSWRRRWARSRRRRSPTSRGRARPASSPSISTDGDRLIGVALTDGKHDVMLFSSGGKAVRFDENDVRPMGRNAHGVRGMMLDKGQKVISMLVAEDETQSVLTATENGYGKRTPIVEYTRHGRGTKGMIAIQQSSRNGQVVGAALVRPDDEVDADLDRRRADPHGRQVDPRDEPLDAGRDADQPRRRREARRPRARRRARRRGSE